MIANFFQNLDARRVEQLLISGQAAVLYGAAAFSEDIDLWINPTAENCQRLILALRDCGARYYKLTPPLTVENLAKGHGFHFTLGEDEPVFLDVMGRPPRVADFDIAAGRRRWMDTEWGRLPVVGLKDLVELKKTQRLEDYPVISNLALSWLEDAECAGTNADLAWALENIFTVSTLQTLFERHPRAAELTTGDQAGALRAFAGDAAKRDLPGEEAETRIIDWIQGRIAALQRADRHYWRPIIAELKTLRATHRLAPEGAAV